MKNAYLRTYDTGVKTRAFYGRQGHFFFFKKKKKKNKKNELINTELLRGRTCISCKTHVFRLAGASKKASSSCAHTLCLVQTRSLEFAVQRSNFMRIINCCSNCISFFLSAIDTLEQLQRRQKTTSCTGWTFCRTPVTSHTCHSTENNTGQSREKQFSSSSDRCKMGKYRLSRRKHRRRDKEP